MAECVADLHMHSQCSDGTQSPEALMQTMAAHGLRVVALTDHDTVAGWTAARQAGEDAGIQVVPGVELSVTVDGHEVHLLGYGFDPGNAALQRHLDRFAEARADRVRRMVKRLQSEGLSISMHDVRAAAGDATAWGRPHVAAALCACGAVDTVDDAFRTYIGNGKVAFVPKPPVPARDAMARVRNAGGISVLAHPGHWTPRSRIRRLMEDGLDGIEVVHPAHEPYLQDYYATFATRHGLLQTGGSDFHGRDDENRIGRYGLGNDQWERLCGALT